MNFAKHRCLSAGAKRASSQRLSEAAGEVLRWQDSVPRLEEKIGEAIR
jgi:hypothetical protein